MVFNYSPDINLPDSLYIFLILKYMTRGYLGKNEFLNIKSKDT